MLDAKIASALRRIILRRKEFEKYSMNSSKRKQSLFPDFEMLDALTASALKEIIANQYFPRRVNVEERTAQKHYRLFYEEGRLLT